MSLSGQRPSCVARVLDALLVMALAVPQLRADDPIVTRAMTASTIAEVFVTDGSVRVELEIGEQDLPAFANLLPDEIYARFGRDDTTPWSDRLARFFREDWVLRIAGGEPASGRVVELVERRRVVRDLITGAPLPSQPGRGVPVLFAVLEFDMPTRPASLSLSPPTRGEDGGAAANIGFVLYHAGLPVNDFRYLAKEETLDLDWTDPWFTRFHNPNLKRRFAAPMSAYLYIEHFEVRQEIVLRPRDLQPWIDLGLDGAEVIAADAQEEIERRVVEFLCTCNRVHIDGKLVEPQLDRIHFLRRTLRQTSVIDLREDLPVHAATLGVVLRFDIDALPNEVTMQWDLFSPRFPEVPASATDEAGGMPTLLTAEDPVLRWQNFLTNPRVPGVVPVQEPPRASQLVLPLLSLGCAALAGWVLVRLLRPNGQRPSKLLQVAAVAAIPVGALTWPLVRVPIDNPFAGTPSMTSWDTQSVLGTLLYNVYRAFDSHGEGRIYDTLARSVDGDLLSDVYIETRRALVLESQGGARTKVSHVDVLEVDAEPLRDEAGALVLELRGRWIVTGSVGHWGHIHQRRNQYDGSFTIRAVDGSWKITALDLLDEQRLDGV